MNTTDSNQSGAPDPAEDQDVSTPPVTNPPVFSRLNWIILLFGVILLIAGYYVLSKVDVRAENLAGAISPLLIVGGYVVVFISIIMRPEHS